MIPFAAPRRARIESQVVHLVVVLSLVFAAAHADDTPARRQAYFGDLHLHTSFSFDAYFWLQARITPEEAYRYARGETIEFEGQRIRRRWPLDFLAVTDHSENMGIAQEASRPGTPLYRSDLGKRTRDAGNQLPLPVLYELYHRHVDPRASRSAWGATVQAARRNYRPGEFTTFIGYEWSASVGDDFSRTLHRNVIFKGDDAPFPFSTVDSERPEDLWRYLESNRRRGVEALAIPHNANLSGGLMYDWYDSDGKAIDEVYAQRRMLNEPLSEISQHKGQSETLQALSPQDDLADFEPFPMWMAKPEVMHGSYVREAYGRGLVIARRAGANPYKFGLVGGSDSHTGLSVSEPEPYGDLTMASKNAYLSLSRGNLTGVWAEENTRESIYSALRRKETFATSGPRIRLRLFASWNYPENLFQQTDWPAVAYSGGGVPMGSDLPMRPAERGAPQLALWASKDPDGANLERLQVVKVWLASGGYAEKVFDVALVKRTESGNTVDLHNATYANTIGAAQLRAVWRDPQFDASVPAVYYLRAIEIPTPRWSTIWNVRNKRSLPEGVPPIIQERAWSSPIWYTPSDE